VNKWDFRLHLSTQVSVIAWRCGGRQFLAAGPVWLKLHSRPNFVLVVCLMYLAMSVDLRCRQLPKEADVHCPLDTVLLGQCGSGSSADGVYTWFCLQLVTSGVATKQVSHGLVNEDQAPDELPHFELFVMVQLLYVAVQLAERYNNLYGKGWELRRAVDHRQISFYSNNNFADINDRLVPLSPSCFS